MTALKLTCDNGVQTIKFTRPEKKNALNEEMYKGVIKALNTSREDDSVVLTVLTGSGNYYSSGNDFSITNITDMKKSVEEATKRTRDFVDALIDYPKLLIAVVNGPAIGLAATTLALCDVVFASDKAWFRTPFTQLGLNPEACSSITFPRIMGSARASKLLYLNGTMSAEEAQACGFVTQVYPDSTLQSQTTEQIYNYAQLPLQSLQLSKKLIRDWDKELLHKVNEKEIQVLCDRLQSEEFFNVLLRFQNKKSKL